MSQAEIVDRKWERLLGGLNGGNTWVVVPENLEGISPKERCHFHIHMYGDGEISIYFAHKDKSDGWQKDVIFRFSRYWFERYSGQSVSISDNMNAILSDLQLHQISDDVAAKINAECIGDWQPIDPKDNRKRFW